MPINILYILVFLDFSGPFAYHVLLSPRHLISLIGLLLSGVQFRLPTVSNFLHLSLNLSVV